MDGIACAVDTEDRVIAVGRRRWDRFAIESGTPELCADSIVGRNLFEFVSAPDMRQAYRELAEKSSRPGSRSLLPLVATDRCRAGAAPVDCSAGLADNGPGLLFQAQIVGRTIRPPIDIFDFEALLSALKQEPDPPIVTMCSFCQRLRRPGAGDRRLGLGGDVLSARRHQPAPGSAMACVPIATPSGSRSGRTQPQADAGARSSPVQGIRELLLVHLRAPRDVAFFCLGVEFAPGLFAAFPLSPTCRGLAPLSAS